MTLRNFLMASFALLTLTACGGKPASDLYVLRVPDNMPDGCTTSHTLLIERPSAPNEYDTKRIAVMLDKNHLNYYTGATWASPFPEQLQGFMSDAFARNGVNMLDGNAADTDHASTLHITIREADVTDVNAPTVHLRLTGSITTPSGHATRFKVNEQVPAEENHMPQIIDAYDQAALNAVSTITKAMKLRCQGVLAGD